MVLPQDQKWTIKEQEDSRVPETTNNLLNDFMGTMSKTLAIVSRTSKTTLFHLVLSSWKNSTKWSTSLFRKRSNKMIIGKILASFSLDLTAQVRVNTKSCNGSEAISINSHQMIVTACTELMLTWSCWAWHCQWKISALSESNIFTQATRSKLKTPKSRSSFSSKWSSWPF